MVIDDVPITDNAGGVDLFSNMVSTPSMERGITWKVKRAHNKYFCLLIDISVSFHDRRADR